MKKFFKSLSIGLAICSCAIFIIGGILNMEIPNNYKVTKNSGLNVVSSLPISIDMNSKEDLVEAGVVNSSNQTYNADLKLMNIIPLKSVNVQVVEETKVVPCGVPFGVKIFTDGVVVVGISDVKVNLSTVNPAKDAGLKIGDVIMSIDNNTVNSNEEVAKYIQNCNGNPLTLSVRRENMTFSTEICPVKSEDSSYKAGLWVRDSSAGIGTLTYYNPEQQVFAGLGHGICDVDTGELMPLRNGDIVPAIINGVVKGEKGTPGELRGYFSDQNSIGTLLANVNTGVYGVMNKAPVENQPLVVAMKQQVKPGKAQILTTINGQAPQYYDIAIIKSIPLLKIWLYESQTPNC